MAALIVHRPSPELETRRAPAFSAKITCSPKQKWSNSSKLYGSFLNILAACRFPTVINDSSRRNGRFLRGALQLKNLPTHRPRGRFPGPRAPQFARTCRTTITSWTPGPTAHWIESAPDSEVDS